MRKEGPSWRALIMLGAAILAAVMLWVSAGNWGRSGLPGFWMYWKVWTPCILAGFAAFPVAGSVWMAWAHQKMKNELRVERRALFRELYEEKDVLERERTEMKELVVAINLETDARIENAEIHARRAEIRWRREHERRCNAVARGRRLKGECEKLKEDADLDPYMMCAYPNRPCPHDATLGTKPRK